ncbi:sugar kinase [bacterium]|nr:sugar kinase [bacterium]
MSQVVTFGEIMARLAPPGFQRLKQGLPGVLNVTFAGAEANVAASLSMMGSDATFVTALPKNDLAEACAAALRSTGVHSHLVFSDQGRLGLYFLETGANQRPSRVMYDRDHSSISLTDGDAYDWDLIFADADWFHVTGITPAVSETATEATLTAVRRAKELGLTVSCDLNFRGKLWKWRKGMSSRELAREIMPEVLRSVDVLVANEEDCGDVLGIKASGSDISSGVLEADRYPDVARRVVQQFPHLQIVATTLRQSLSASFNRWGAMLFDAKNGQAFFSPVENGSYQPYEIRNIVDRVGGGDSFAAGLIHGLRSDPDSDFQTVLNYATAASCLAHSVEGDFNYSSREEIEALAGGSSSGRVVR